MKTKKNKMPAIVASAVVAALAAGCDQLSGSGEMKAERNNRAYQEAMADYSAGRLDAAQKGFEKVIRADPSNASARFQLACMLQDRKADYLSAYCGYREYLLREPKSDKAALARERAEICRREAAKEMAKELGLGGGADDSGAAASALEEAAALRKKVAKLEKALAESDGKAARLESENARLRRMVTSIGEDTSRAGAMDVASAKDLLDDDGDDGAPAPSVSSAAALLDDEPDTAAAMGGAALDDARRLGEDEGESALLAGERTPAPAKLTELGGRRKHKGDFGPADVSHPDSYVVQEGDTLYNIAVRFYGKASAWKKIREANKATVTTDGRVKAGQRLVLP